jgi:tetratricopeptide (TPR) repeat protein
MIRARTAFVLIGLLLIFATAGAAVAAESEPGKEQIYPLFNQANEAFRQANSTANDAERERLYQKAILAFEKIIEQGRVSSAGLYYNLANTYFLKGDLGRAILNYRRAAKLDKADTNIQKNLRFARDKRIDKVKVETEKRVLQTLFFWHYDFSVRTKFVLAIVFFALLFLGLTVMVWFGRSAAAMATTVICGILMVCLVVSVFLEVRLESNRACGVITARQVTAHQADWKDSPPSFKEPLHAGTEFDLIEHRPGWYHIRLVDGSEGWISETAAEII